MKPEEIGRSLDDLTNGARGLRIYRGEQELGFWEACTLQAGDVIVEIAGQTITNIYDYTYALDVLKIGQPAKVIYMREGKKQETTLTPSARK